MDAKSQKSNDSEKPDVIVIADKNTATNITGMKKNGEANNESDDDSDDDVQVSFLFHDFICAV